MIVKNDLYDYDLKIYQDSEKFKFSLDSLLLAEFVEIKKNDNQIIDFCSGNAPVPMIIAKKYKHKVIGIEIQQEIYELANKSIKENQLEDMVTMYNMNVKDTPNILKRETFDVITCNPPFFKVDKTSFINTDISKASARHELSITLEEMFTTADTLLKNKGKLYMVHRPERLQEILEDAIKHHFFVKELKFITSKSEEYAIMILLKFIKNGQIGTKVSSKVINRDTKTYKEIFKKEAK